LSIGRAGRLTDHALSRRRPCSTGRCEPTGQAGNEPVATSALAGRGVAQV